MGFLSLARGNGEGITILNKDSGEVLYINVTECNRDGCKIHIDAPKNYVINRNELLLRRYSDEQYDIWEKRNNRNTR